MLTDLLKTGTEVITKDTNNKWEMYINYIKKNGTYQEITIDTAYAYADAFDIYATFTKMGIAERFHYPLMRLNNYKSPADFDGTNRKLLIYDSSFMESIYIKYIIS